MNQNYTFVDFSKYNLEVYSKESYETIFTLMNLIKNEDHPWTMFSDLKVIGLLLGIQVGYTKYFSEISFQQFLLGHRFVILQKT